MTSLKKITLILVSLSFILTLSMTGQSPVSVKPHKHSGGPLNFIENKNQWHGDVLFKTTFEGNNTLFIEDQGFTFLITSSEDLEKFHKEHLKPPRLRQNISIKNHAYKVKFLGSSPSKGVGIAPRKAYHNYLLGNDKSKWAGHVRQYGKVLQKGIYPGIDLETYSQNGHLKYDFVISPNADPSIIKIQYNGADKLELVEGNLNIHMSLGLVTEMTPVAWQYINDQRVQVPCYYSLTGNTISYSFPEGYDRNQELIIDPVIIASTLTGTTGLSSSWGNFGHSGTYDNGGNIYAAGISFVPTFPTTTGAFQIDWAGGNGGAEDTDIAIVKYNPDGTDLIYATYVGGTGADWPHSIIADFNQQLYIYGSTNSFDYPVTTNAFQDSFGGDRDVIVTILNQDGSALVGSSYFGGSGADGYNDNFFQPTHSDGDEYRGEIVIDGQNNVYVVSHSQSNNFPVTANAFDNSLNTIGFIPQDVVVFKANNDLSTLFWSTFLGGSDLDSGNGIRVDDNLNVYVTGTAGGSDFPTTNGTIQPTWPGGDENGYLAKLSADGSTLLASTFFGTSGDDNSYFLDIDEDDQVHIYGKTTGIVPIMPATVYSMNPGSKQFLAAFSNDLTQTVYSTVIGNGPNIFGYDFVPVAFMVDKCNGIYFSGYYAEMGLPTTAGSYPDLIPFEPDFYLGVLTPNAEDLHYATYYGEADHVDGGTSRFDKSGVVYQAVCSCTWNGPDRQLTTLPNAWATGQQTGCDIGVFKLDLEIESINANGIALPATSGCAPFEVDFIFTGTNATTFEWSIDGNVVSNLPDHSYTFENAGNYDVQLAVSNPTACNPMDSFHLVIEVLDGESTLTDTLFCVGDELYLDVSTPNGSYIWQDGSTVATYTVEQPGTYWVDVSIGGCARRDSFNVNSASEVTIDLGPDTSFCDVNNFLLNASTPGIASYQWQNGSISPTFNATEDGLYEVIGIDTNGCAVIDNIELIFGETLVIDLGEDETLCDNATLTLTPDLQGADPTWQDGSTGETFTVTEPGVYSLELNNDGCLSSDFISINYFPPISVNATGTDILCASDCNGLVETIPSGGSGSGYQILWNMGSNASAIENLCPNTYSVTITDSNNCTAEANAIVNAPDPLGMTISIEHVECAGDMDGFIEISSVTGGVTPYGYAFNNGSFGSETGIYNLNGGTYQITVQDANDCLIEETIIINEPYDFIINAGQDVDLQLGEATQFDAQVIPYIDQIIAWSPPDFLDCTDCLSPTLCPTNTTLYLLTVTDPNSGCFLIDSLLVTVDKKRNIYIPNAFSPNDDGLNDFFIIYGGIGVESIMEFKIFDRWGEMVFENYDFQPNDFAEGWDGIFKDENMDPALFVYYARVKFKDEEIIMYEGEINLIK